MHTLELFVVHSMCFGLFHLGLSCPNGGFQNVQPQFGQGCLYRCHCLNDTNCDSDTGNCPGQCDAGWMGPGCQYGDIAYHKAARQTSTAGNHGPDQAVDGDFSTCSQTLSINDPWWTVNLGAIYRISGLIINSNDTDALKGFELRVGNVSSDMPSVYPKSCFRHNITDHLGATFHVVCSEEQVGQYLMIQVPGRNTSINLCDVRVYGGRSVAYQRAATQADGYKDASLAVDGGTNTTFNNGTCTHTYEVKSPWWRVDLGQVYTIMRMEIFNRQDCCAERLKGFSISFAVIDERFSLVYKYPETTPNETTEVANLSSTSARYVKIALPDIAPKALSLCEVFIYGECPDNFCGWSCESPCFCAGPIDKRNKIDGFCPGDCAENWDGSKCNSCRPGLFGVNCNQQCGKCAMDGSCNMTTGMCIYGCLPGWTNNNCSIVCPVGLFGQNCSQTCGHCANDSICNHVNGTCTDGCFPGYSGSLCNTVCTMGLFGQNCSQTCGHCANDSSCRHINGTCTGVCSPGYNGSLCNTVCSLGWFGQNCNKKCGHCDLSCHHVNGTCTDGCSPGYSGSLCDTVCSLGWFGQNCIRTCGHCANDSSCHHVNGTCTEGCSPGYSGFLCDTGLALNENTNGSAFNPQFIGIIVGTCLSTLLIGIAVGYFLMRIRMRRSASAASPIQESTYDQLDRARVQNDSSADYAKIEMQRRMKY